MEIVFIQIVENPILTILWKLNCFTNYGKINILNFVEKFNYTNIIYHYQKKYETKCNQYIIIRKQELTSRNIWTSLIDTKVMP